MGSSGFESKGSHYTERGLHPSLPVQTQPNQVTNGHKQLCQPKKTVPPSGGTVSAHKQKCSRTGSKPKLTGFLQPFTFGSQTQQPVETHPGPKHLEHLPKHRVVQNGDPRDHKDLPSDRGVGHFHRLQGRILPHTNSQSVQEIHAFSHLESVLPVQSSIPFGLSTAPMEFTVVAKEVKLMALQRGIRTHQYLDDWLVRATSHQTCLQHTQTLVALCRELGWLVNEEKSELEPKQVFNFIGYQFDLREGKAGGKQCSSRSTITPSKTCSANLYRRIKRRVGRSLKRAHCKGNLVSSRKQVSLKSPGTKSGISGLKRVPRPLFKQHSPGSHRQHTSGCLYQQRRRDEVRLPVCPTVENSVLVHQETANPQGTSHPRPAERDSRQAIQTWPDHSNGMVPSSRSVQSYMLPVAPATSGPVCHQVHYHSLCHRFRTPRHGQWMHSASPGKIWTHTPFHQQPSWAKWWRSCRTTLTTGLF